jgi:hypothetical protein
MRGQRQARRRWLQTMVGEPSSFWIALILEPYRATRDGLGAMADNAMDHPRPLLRPSGEASIREAHNWSSAL